MTYQQFRFFPLDFEGLAWRHPVPVSSGNVDPGQHVVLPAGHWDNSTALL